MHSLLNFNTSPIIACRPCPCSCGVAICPPWPCRFFRRSRCFLLGLLVEWLGQGGFVDRFPRSLGFVLPSGCCRFLAVAFSLSFAFSEDRLTPSVWVAPLPAWRRFRFFPDAVSCEIVLARTAPMPLMRPQSSEDSRFLSCRQAWLQVLQLLPQAGQSLPQQPVPGFFRPPGEGGGRPLSGLIISCRCFHCSPAKL